jgi:hypothetical protein
MWEVCGKYQYTSFTTSRGAHELQEWLFFLHDIFSWSPWRIDFCCGHDRSWAHHHENIENGQEWLFVVVMISHEHIIMKI